MIIKRIRAQNFGSFRNIEVYPLSGIIGVFGKNDINEFHSNGTGKSTLFEVINFVIFARSERGNFSDLYNCLTDGDLIGEIDFLKDNIVYQIVRSWNEKNGGFVTLHINNVEFRGSVREVQRRIDTIIGVSYSTFVATSFFLQGKNDSFTSASSSERLKYLREILGLQFWDRCYDRTVKKLKSLRLRDVSLQSQVYLLRQNVLDYEKQYSFSQICEKVFRKREIETYIVIYSDEIYRIDMDILQYQNRLIELYKIQEKIQFLTKSISEKEAEYQSFQKRLSVLRVPDFINIGRSVDTFIESSRNRISESHRLITELKTERYLLNKNLSLSVGECITCKQIVSEKYVEDLRAITRRSICLIDQQIVLRSNECSDQQKLLDRLLLLQSKNKIASFDIDQLFHTVEIQRQAREKEVSLIKEREEYNKCIEQTLTFLSVEIELEQLKKERQIIMSLLLSYIQEMSSLSTQLETIQQNSSKLKVAQTNLFTVEKEIHCIKTEILCLETLERIFNKGGISFFIIKTVVEQELEPMCNDTFHQFETWSIKFLPFPEKDKLDIFIAPSEAVVRKYETFSRGERELLNFAIRMSLSKLLKKRNADASILFVVLDEIFGFLDVHNKEILETVLLMLKKEFQQLFIISHVPLNIIFDDVIHIVKQCNVSYLDGGQRVC